MEPVKWFGLYASTHSNIGRAAGCGTRDKGPETGGAELHRKVLFDGGSSGRIKPVKKLGKEEALSWRRTTHHNSFLLHLKLGGEVKRESGHCNVLIQHFLALLFEYGLLVSSL